MALTVGWALSNLKLFCHPVQVGANVLRLVPIVLRIFVCIIWFGIQAYWGGQAMRVCIGAVIPGMCHVFEQSRSFMCQE